MPGKQKNRSALTEYDKVPDKNKVFMISRTLFYWHDQLKRLGISKIDKCLSKKQRARLEQCAKEIDFWIEKYNELASKQEDTTAITEEAVNTLQKICSDLREIPVELHTTFNKNRLKWEAKARSSSSRNSVSGFKSVSHVSDGTTIVSTQASIVEITPRSSERASYCIASYETAPTNTGDEEDDWALPERKELNSTAVIARRFSQFLKRLSTSKSCDSIAIVTPKQEHEAQKIKRSLSFFMENPTHQILNIEQQERPIAHQKTTETSTKSCTGCTIF